MPSAGQKLDPILFAVIQARISGIINEMAGTIIRTSRNPILYSAKDFSCSVLTYDAKLLTMSNSLPIHLIGMGNALPAVAECFKGDLHPGDCFVNNSPYYGNTHAGDFTMFAPVFFEGELVCWAGSVCHLIDIGAYVPSSGSPLARDVFEEGLHFPPFRLVKGYQEIPDVVRLIKNNFRYPEQWHGDFLAQVGSLFVAERAIIKLCEKYGAETIRRFQDELIAYGDRRMTEEIKQLPQGTWAIEALSEKVKPWAPEGLRLKLKMSIDPTNAVITYDLLEMPDQLPWGMNLSEACSKGAVIEGSMPCLDPSLPRNDGVFRHFNILLRDGSVAGKPRWPASAAAATINIADEVANMVLRIWEQVEPGRGHAANSLINSAIAFSSGVDFRHHNTPYGHEHQQAVGGGGASKGCDGWPGFFANCIMGNMNIESAEVAELKVPCIIWEAGIAVDSGGSGKWRGAPGQYQRIQPRNHTMLALPIGIGHTDAPLGIAGGKPGALADHWLEKHATREKVTRLPALNPFQAGPDEDWVAFSNGGGGYGDPMEREPDAVREDARNGIVSVRAAREDYGVVLDTGPELFQVDYEATRQLRMELRKRGTGVG